MSVRTTNITYIPDNSFRSIFTQYNYVKHKRSLMGFAPPYFFAVDRCWILTKLPHAISKNTWKSRKMTITINITPSFLFDL